MNMAAFMALIEKKKWIYGIYDVDIADVIGLSERSYKRRKSNPESFSIKEFLRIMKFLKFTPEEKKEVFS